jgi:hypothetical protein
LTRKKPIITLFKDDEKTTREKVDDLVFKSDRLRQRYDLRYADSDRVNNIFQRGYIIKLKKETEERKKEKEQQPNE